MATGFRLSNGLDLDQVFAARVSAAGASVGMRNSAGTDLSQVFEPGQQGVYSTLTGFKNSAGTDFKSLFSTVAGAPTNFTGTLSKSAISGIVTGSFSVNTDGTVTITGGLTSTKQWYTPSQTGVGSDYQVRFTSTVTGSGSTTQTYNPVLGTWATISANKTCTFSANATNTSLSGTVTIQIRRVSDSVVVCTGTIDVDVHSGAA